MSKLIIRFEEFIIKKMNSNSNIYAVLLCFFVIVTLATILVNDPVNNPVPIAILAGIGGGGVASVYIAWLIDLQNRKAERERKETIRKFYFSDLEFHIKTAFDDIPLALGDSVPNDGKNRTWTEWLGEIDKDAPLVKTWAMCVEDSFIKARVQISNIINEKLLIVEQGLLSGNDVEVIQHIDTSLDMLSHMFSRETFLWEYAQPFVQGLKRNLSEISFLSYLNEYQIENMKDRIDRLQEEYEQWVGEQV